MRNPLSQPLPLAGERSHERPLAGLRIIDLSMGWAGPICTRNLADLGADVIKIEACGYPDWWRGVDNRNETVTQRLYEKSARFNIMNRGKRAITLDLTVPEGLTAFRAGIMALVMERGIEPPAAKCALECAQLIHDASRQGNALADTAALVQSLSKALREQG